MSPKEKYVKELKPAHQIITENIATLTRNIQGLESMITAGGTTTAGGNINISAGDLYFMQSQEIGGMCALLKVLTDMIIPPTELEWVIVELKKLTYIHAVIYGTIQSLEQRAKASASAA